MKRRRQNSIWWMVLIERDAAMIKGETHIWCKDGIERENDRRKDEGELKWK